MSQPQAPFTTPERLSEVIAESVAVDAEALQAAIGQLVVATSAEYPAVPSDARSVHDESAGVTVLLADRFPVGLEARALGIEIMRHHGQLAAQAVLGDRAVELRGATVSDEAFLLDEYSNYVAHVAEGDPMHFDDWLAGSDLPEIVHAREREQSLMALSNFDVVQKEQFGGLLDDDTCQVPLKVALQYALWCKESCYKEKNLRDRVVRAGASFDDAFDVCQAFNNNGGMIGALSEFGKSEIHQNALNALQSVTFRDFEAENALRRESNNRKSVSGSAVFNNNLNPRPVSQPPEMNMTHFGWPASEPVLGYTHNGEAVLVTFEQMDDENPGKVSIYSKDSERWNMTGKIVAWIGVPDPTAVLQAAVHTEKVVSACGQDDGPLPP